MQQTAVFTNNIHLNVMQAGDANAPLIILLHGFPEFWHGWHKQIPALTAAGYRVWAPDQRGYNLSDKPQGIAAYNLDQLAADIIGLIDAAGADKVYLVGHDWGAAVAWWLATKYPQRLHKLVILNVPHHQVMGDYLRQNFAQLLRSWYMFFFQIPWLPERLLRIGNWQPLIRTLKQSSQPNTFSEADFATYRQAWNQPGASTAMLNWYRAIAQKRPSFPANSPITTPTLIIWGQQDAFLAHEMAELSVKKCENGRLITIPTATHWVQHEAADQVNNLIVSFFEDGD